MDLPVVFQYQRALDAFRRGSDAPASLLKRMSELISLLDLTTTLNSSLTNDEILEAALLVVMGELQTRRGCLLVQGEGREFRVKASRGLPAGAPERVLLEPPSTGSPLRDDAEGYGDLFAALGLELLCPIFKDGRAIALMGVGPRADARPYGAEEQTFLRSVAACAATPIENGRIYHELKRLNQKLSVKVFQLNTLFDISRELTASFEEESIENVVTTTLMGHLMVSRCALYLAAPEGLLLVHQRGLRSEEDATVVPDSEARPILRALGAPRAVTELPPGPFRDRLLRWRMALAVPLCLSHETKGLVAVGERASGAPFSEEDGDFAMTLGRQAMAALENVRLHRVRVEKERRDREMQIAREIQRSLFPRSCPQIPGFEVAAESRSCYEVGGDHYDFIPLSGGRVALAVADVSGKGTPASILMASVHASLQALAGTVSPPVLMERLNRFLFASTQANKYVTMFYAELDPVSRRLSYVNAGHIPPYRLEPGGGHLRLTAGGPVLGLLEDVSFEAGELVLASGEVVAMVTDGATEALSTEEVEFGDERVLAALSRAARGSAAEILRSLVAAVDSWAGPAGCSDDLTALVLKAL